MDELLNAVQQRKAKIGELGEIRQNMNILSQLTQQERQNIYATIRKIKEEEKNRTEKENWIVQIMRNTKTYSEEQMCHIFIKTNEIMKAIEPHFSELPYQPPTNLINFLEMYYSLHQSYYLCLSIDMQIKASLKQCVKQGNITCVTDLLKSLLTTSRKLLRDSIDELGGIQSNKDNSPDKYKMPKRLAPDPMIDNIRSRSTYADQKQTISVSKIANPNLTQSIIQINNCDEQNRKEQKEQLQPMKDTRNKYSKRLIITQKILSNQLENSLADSPLNINLKTKLNQSKMKEQDKSQFISQYTHITPVIDDLDEQNLAVLDYQSAKRQQQNYEDFKINFDIQFERLKSRNQQLQYSITQYYDQIEQDSQNEPFIQLLQKKYYQLSNKMQLQLFHFCYKKGKPTIDIYCTCQERQSKSENQKKQLELFSPLKNKIIIRKQDIRQQTHYKSNSNTNANSINTSNSRNLIDQLRQQKIFSEQILQDESGPSQLYRVTYQNTPNANNLSNSISRNLKIYNPVPYQKLYQSKIISNENSQSKLQSQSRTQSAQQQLKNLTNPNQEMNRNYI